MHGANDNRALFRQQRRRAGEHIQFSQVNCTAADRVGELQRKIVAASTHREKTILSSMLSLLNELMLSNEMPLDICYDEYLARLPEEYHPKSKRVNARRQTFRESLLQERRGLPVIIVTLNMSNPAPHVVLMDCPESNISFIEGLNNVMSESQETHMFGDLPDHFKNVMGVFNSRRERAAAICMLALIFTTNSLRNNLGLNENVVGEMKKTVLDISEKLSDRTEEATKANMTKLTKLVDKLEKEAEDEEERIDKIHAPQAAKEVEYAQFQLKNRKKRIDRIKKNHQQMAKKAAKKEVKKWKETLLSQKGKGKGKHRIDRGAEKVVYRALCEQLAAHDRRRGNPDTEYVDVHQRKHSKDLQLIANQWLAENGKKLIKSASTIRSWAAPSNKRYRSAQDHRGQGLWKFSRRSEKKYADRHINIHYNRAVLKNYFRFCFSKANGEDFKNKVIRRAIDDKAYLRCGTAEGFSRPLHKPPTLTNPDLQKHLPVYDFPTEAGYVAPGVIQMIEDMDEIDHKYSIASNSISVITKPKLVYPSSATNWMNDLYATRMRFPDQHEINTGKEPPVESKERTALCHLIYLQDTLVQYTLMDIEDDYMKVTEGSEFLEREVLRHTVVLHRVQSIIGELEEMQQYLHHIPRMRELCASLEDFLEELPSLKEPEDIDVAFSTVSIDVTNFLQGLRKEKLPRHRPVDIQSSDAGPGVGTGERMVRIRNAEYFMINDLDLQCRMHYAPRDSKMHSVEKIMSTLNEAAGDGTSIEVKRPTLFQEIGEDKLLQMSVSDFKQFEVERNESISKECAQSVALKYQGVKCRGTFLHAETPSYIPYEQLFFDEKYMKQCCAAASQTSLESIPGSHYFRMVSNFISVHYILYDNGIEGIRDACKESPCQYHTERGCNFSTDGIARIPPPVPDYSNVDKFSYLNPVDVKAGNITAAFGIDVDTITAGNRQPNDFCPRTQLNLLMKECGDPKLQVTEHVNADGSVSYRTVDVNNTVAKIKEQLPDFIQKYVGEDLKDEVYDFMENEYVKKVKMAIRKKENLQLREEEDAKVVEDIDWEKLVTSGSLNSLKVAQLDLYLMDIVGKTAAQVRKAGYLKKDKIMDVTAHFYTCKGNIFTKEVDNTLNLTFG